MIPSSGSTILHIIGRDMEWVILSMSKVEMLFIRMMLMTETLELMMNF
jgi:hypothetical protein